LLLDGRASADDHIQIAILNEPSATHDKRVLTRTDGEQQSRRTRRDARRCGS